MAKYRKKPIVIEAFRYWTDSRPPWFVTAQGHEVRPYGGYCEIHTLEGVMRGKEGDYIIRGVKGEIYPCKPDIFEATYELVQDTNET